MHTCIFLNNQSKNFTREKTKKKKYVNNINDYNTSRHNGAFIFNINTFDLHLDYFEEHYKTDYLIYI